MFLKETFQSFLSLNGRIDVTNRILHGLYVIIYI